MSICPQTQSFMPQHDNTIAEAIHQRQLPAIHHSRSMSLFGILTVLSALALTVGGGAMMMGQSWVQGAEMASPARTIAMGPTLEDSNWTMMSVADPGNPPNAPVEDMNTMPISTDTQEGSFFEITDGSEEAMADASFALVGLAGTTQFVMEPIQSEIIVPTIPNTTDDPLKPFLLDDELPPGLEQEAEEDAPPPDPLRDVSFTGFIDSPVGPGKVALLTVLGKTLVKKPGEGFVIEGNQVSVTGVDRHSVELTVNGAHRTLLLEPFLDNPPPVAAPSGGALPPPPASGSTAAPSAGSGNSSVIENELLEELEE